MPGGALSTTASSSIAPASGSSAAVRRSQPSRGRRASLMVSEKRPNGCSRSIGHAAGTVDQFQVALAAITRHGQDFVLAPVVVAGDGMDLGQQGIAAAGQHLVGIELDLVGGGAGGAAAADLDDD